MSRPTWPAGRHEPPASTADDLDSDLDLVLTVTCRDQHAERADLPDIRWFGVALSQHDVESLKEADTGLAHARVVLIGLDHGLEEAFLQTDGHSGELATPMEEILQLDRAAPLGRMLPRPRMIVLVEHLEVPEPQRGHGYGHLTLTELATHFAFLAGPGLLVAQAEPDEPDDVDPFTLRAATRRLETIMTRAGMHQIGTSTTWYADLATVTRTS